MNRFRGGRGGGRGRGGFGSFGKFQKKKFGNDDGSFKERSKE